MLLKKKKKIYYQSEESIVKLYKLSDKDSMCLHAFERPPCLLQFTEYIWYTGVWSILCLKQFALRITTKTKPKQKKPEKKEKEICDQQGFFPLLSQLFCEMLENLQRLLP